MRKCRKYCNEIDFFSLRCNCAIEKLLTCAKHAHNTRTHLQTHNTHLVARNASRDDDDDVVVLLMMTMATIAL